MKKNISNFLNRFTVFILCFLVSVIIIMPNNDLIAQHRHGGHPGGHPGGPHHMHHPPMHHGPHVHFGFGPHVFMHPGPRWHPIGFFITTIAVTAIVVSVVNKNNEKEQYKYDDGTYYKESTQDGQKGYVAVPAPIGARVPILPDDNTEINGDDGSKYYYYASTFYIQDGDEYVVVQPPVGATVPYVPDDAQKKKVNDVEYYVYNGIYYQAKSSNGDVVYEVVEHP